MGSVVIAPFWQFYHREKTHSTQFYRRVGGPQRQSAGYIAISSHNITTRDANHFLNVLTLGFILVK